MKDMYKIYDSLIDGTNKDFSIYLPNTNHLVRDIDLSESSIIF